LTLIRKKNRPKSLSAIIAFSIFSERTKIVTGPCTRAYTEKTIHENVSDKLFRNAIGKHPEVSDEQKKIINIYVAGIKK